MKEMTDRELTDKISQVFENFEDPDAAQGWQELRKKYPENKIRPLLFWWAAAAAVLLLIGGLWFITPIANESSDEISEANPKKQIEEVQTDRLPENNLATEIETRNGNGVSPDNSNYTTDASSSQNGNLENLIPSNTTSVNEPSIFETSKRLKPAHTAHISIAVQKSDIQSSNPGIPVKTFAELVSTLTKSNIKGVSRDSSINLAARMIALAKLNNETDNHVHDVEKTPYTSKKSITPKNTMSFYAGSYINYSLGSEKELNFGAGFSSDIRLTSNLKLSTGIALAKNSLRYNDGVPSSSKQKLDFFALPSFGPANSGLVNNNLTTITSYEAQLLALDIPVNLKYVIIPKDNKLYLLAGLSSGTYLDETYSLDYRTYSSAGMYLNQTQATEVKKQLQTFDLARTLNISFGYSSNFGKTQNITIEPFLKYPLGGLGSEDLKFGSAGINLKMNFSNFKQR